MKKWTFGSGSFLCQRFRRRRKETAKKQRRIQTILVNVIFMSHVLTHIVSCKQFCNWIGCAICISRGLLWKRMCYLTLFSLLFDTNCVVVIIGYWSSIHFHHQWIGRQNKNIEIKCCTEWSGRRCLWKNALKPDSFYETKYDAGKNYQT